MRYKGLIYKSNDYINYKLIGNSKINQKSFQLSNADFDMAEINIFSKKELQKEDVYVFSMVLCDNEVDRDLEQFPSDSLNVFANLFVGKPLILDHKHTTDKQIGRIFKTLVEPVESLYNSVNEPYYVLTAQAYIVRNEEFNPIIEKIETGILKEISVATSVNESICSICGNDYWDCNHQKGIEYGQKMCYAKLVDPIDAFEASIVTIPAQPLARITKHYDSEKKGDLKLVYNKRLQNYGMSEKDFEKMQKDGEIDSLELINFLDSYAYDLSQKSVKFDDICDSTGISENDINKDYVINLLKEAKESQEVVKKYNQLKSAAEEEAIKNGVKAYGEDFKEEKWKKIFKTFDIDEINDQSKEWEILASKELNVGKHVSTAPDNDDDYYKLDF